ncbi:MAG: response regulator transcription factor [Dehalococcoidia bacterium]|nr:response regulator transcription factor [Dehalococcoidia bacterium]MDD5647439.1 response regulator transcription factor [Dehalococcoidia bacterium]
MVSRKQRAKKYRLLVVDDEIRILNFLKSNLCAVGYDVVTASSGTEALEQFHASTPDLILLDILMPKTNGLDVLKELRGFSMVPVIFLSAKGDVRARITGLDMGADDYIAKPFSPDELVSRIEAVMRRFKPNAPNIPDELSLGDITIDFKSHKVTVRGNKIYLTRIEWLLLTELALNADRLMTYEELLVRVWGAEYRNDVQFLRTWISRLRRKIEEKPDDPQIILTVTKMGYILKISHP